jgi:hypothetical protein
MVCWEEVPATSGSLSVSGDGWQQFVDQIVDRDHAVGAVPDHYEGPPVVLDLRDEHDEQALEDAEYQRVGRPGLAWAYSLSSRATVCPVVTWSPSRTRISAIFPHTPVSRPASLLVNGGGPRGTRTHNQRIKSPMLCPLS